MEFWRDTATSVTVMVKVRPRARRPGVQGRAGSATGERLKIAVTEAAEDGKANRAVCAALAKVLDVPQSAIHIVTGATNREKLFSVDGDTVSLVTRLKAL